MSESIIFREFEESDRPALEQVIRETQKGGIYDVFITSNRNHRVKNTIMQRVSNRRFSISILDKG